MYLFIFPNATSKQVHENLTVADYVAAGQGLVQIFRIKRDRFYRLVFDITDQGTKMTWVPVPESRTLSCSDGILHV